MTRHGMTVAAILGFLTVALGAFAAHALRNQLSDYGVGVWEKSVRYQMFHVLALTWAAHASRDGGRLSPFAAWAFLSGIVLFCGSLYVLAWTEVKAWGAVTPIGGVAFLLGWSALAIASFQRARRTPARTSP